MTTKWYCIRWSENGKLFYTDVIAQRGELAHIVRLMPQQYTPEDVLYAIKHLIHYMSMHSSGEIEYAL